MNRRLLIYDLYHKSSMGSDPYFVGFTSCAIIMITRIIRSFELMFENYSKESNRCQEHQCRNDKAKQE